MTQTTKPSKESVRDWMQRRYEEEDAPPSIEDIKRELGWALIPENESDIPE